MNPFTQLNRSGRKIEPQRIVRANSFALSVLAILAIGCASQPPQALTTQLAKTDTSIQQAEQAGAAENGLVELQQAKDKRAEAQKALRAKDYDVALRLAQQAQVDAQYASQKSEAREAEESAVEVQRANDAVRREAEREPIR
jgi:hypothetical protein